MVALAISSPHLLAAVESQALGVARSLPAEVERVFSCGTWAEQGQRGNQRIVLVGVSGGAGTEVYVQRVLEASEARVGRVVSTTPIRELNNDHAQYQVVSARCLSSGVVELIATFEHDEGPLERRILIRLLGNGSYTLSNAVIKARRPTNP